MIVAPYYAHPLYNFLDWAKWRLVYNGGRVFIDSYLEKFSQRETDDDFAKRKNITYNPAFAKAAINDIKNSIFQRMSDISRTEGPEVFLDLIEGKKGGVDGRGSTMNTFIGTQVLPEMLILGKVGVFVDAPEKESNLLTETNYPYCYVYKAEDIISWDLNDKKEFKTLLLRHTVAGYQNGLPKDTVTTYKKFELSDNNVIYTEYADEELKEVITTKTLDLPKIPFVLFELSASLLADVADYQIALLNISSSDLGYILKSNFPFYTEQFSPTAENIFGKDTVNPSDDISVKKEITTGVTQGRRYPTGTERPGFIHPSSEPLEVSMAKQEQMKREIRHLVNLAVANIESTRQQSAESKGYDEKTLENGLSYIGLELENGERQIAVFVSMYLNSKEITTIKYPERYSIKSEADRQSEAQNHEKLLNTVPSLTFKKEVSKKIADTVLGHLISVDKLKKINNEIDNAVAISNAELLHSDVEYGIVDCETASKIRVYPEGVVEKAQKERAERMVQSATLQGIGARGLEGEKSDGKMEKRVSQDSDSNGDPGKATK